ncbi:Uncharacterised protein [Slackia heliotrinireducens]|uniref:Transmembrane protein n=1 Tax=Slackia heliotrinireducens (strain ATCC 29202 / DSM 20476 / NCTC 11029 / RHS 1) TaxID=471855 RepID=C7N603_SLAHD|nr:membrane protein [Slackia heliotrinireducens]ACV22338.1 hypothetical protein Shel_13140 [Slackia heliotrinireducens DSM 20476]VEH00580.1 Uncharacterised protein [Slackia heliotrinireducens]
MKRIIGPVLAGILLLVSVACVADRTSNVQTEPSAAVNERWLYGITVDDSWYDDVSTDDIVAAIEDMPVKPTVRLVMSTELSAEDYEPLFAQIHEVAYIMACPVDSSEMNSYKDEQAYLERFQEAYEVLGPYVDLWEIGNEINGVEWIGQEPALIVSKVEVVNDWLRSRDAKTALTMYYARPDDQDMFEWMEENLPEALCENVDYALISYYEDDNEGYIPDWSGVFNSFEDAFPDASVGFGECGNVAEDATEESKLRMAGFYYGLKAPSQRYIGGCFWWNWVQDCIPHEDNAVYDGINQLMETHAA